MIRRRSFVALFAACVFCGSLVAADMEVQAKLVKVDTKSIIVENEKGKKDTYPLTTTVKAFDAKGKVFKEGLKDKAFVADTDLKLVLDEKTKALKEVHLVVPTAKAGGTEARNKIEGGITAKVVKVDIEKRTVSVTLDGGKKADYKIGENVDFIGPRGGKSDKGIKDDRFVEHAEVIFEMDKDKKNVVKVHLPYRNAIDKDEKEKDKKDK